MISVLISSESRYRVNRKSIRELVQTLLGQAGLDDIEVSILVVGTRKIRDLNRHFRQVDEPTDVLSFPQEGGRGPDGILRVGDIIVCFPYAVGEAVKENKLVDVKINELVGHGLRHLLGEHHDD